jgi:5-methylcytosine-specific restriction endonuclease McrA
VPTARALVLCFCVYHIVAIADGGSDALDNADTLCGKCHSEWHMQVEGCVDYADFKLVIPSYVRPAY